MKKRIKITAEFTIDTENILSKDGIAKNSDDSPVYIQAQDSIYAMMSDFVTNLATEDSDISIEVKLWH